MPMIGICLSPQITVLPTNFQIITILMAQNLKTTYSILFHFGAMRLLCAHHILCIYFANEARKYINKYIIIANSLLDFQNWFIAKFFNGNLCICLFHSCYLSVAAPRWVRSRPGLWAQAAKLVYISPSPIPVEAPVNMI